MPRIGSYIAEGPISRYSENSLPQISGVYVVCGPSEKMIDVGESYNIRKRIASHERKPCWRRNGYTDFFCDQCA